MDLYLLITQKPDTKALVHAGISPSSSAWRGSISRTGLPLTPGHRPWLLLVGDHGITGPSSSAPAGYSSTSSPPSAWDQPWWFVVLHSPQGRGAVVLKAADLSPVWHCSQQAPSGPGDAPAQAVALLHPCIPASRAAVQGQLCFLWAIKGSAAGCASCVCSNKLSSARAHHWTWLFILLNYWNALWLAFGQVVLSQMILRHSPRSWLRPGTAPKCNVAAATLFYRVRVFNSLDTGCSIWPQCQRAASGKLHSEI